MSCLSNMTRAQEEQVLLIHVTHVYVKSYQISSIKSLYTSGDFHKRMVRTEENVKISIILVLSITIFTTVLVTGTVINIISSAAYGSAAAKTINVQTKTNQHPVTGTGILHIVSSAAHGSVNVQPNTNQHPVTKTLLGGRASPTGPSGYQCWDVKYYPEPPYGRPMPPIQANCARKIRKFIHTWHNCL